VKPYIYHWSKAAGVIIIVSLFIFSLSSSGCNPEQKTNAANGTNKPVKGKVDFTKLFNKDDLWASNRALAEAAVNNADELKKAPGAMAYFKFLGLIEIPYADDVFPAKDAAATGVKWPNLKQLIDDPLSAMMTCDEALPMGKPKVADAAAQWTEFSTSYGAPITAASMATANFAMASDETGKVLYGTEASGFYTAVDNQASICAYVAMNKLEAQAGFDPATILLNRFKNWSPEIPKDAEGNPDMLGLIGAYDIVTYPYVLDMLYLQTGRVPLYDAMSQILSAYSGGLQVEGLYNRIDTIADKNKTLNQLCMLARLFRRMYGFTDDDVFIEAAEGIVKGVAPYCLTGEPALKLAYLHALALVAEPALHIVIVGPSEKPEWRVFRQLSADRYDPRLAVMALDNKRDAELIEAIEYYATDVPNCFVCIDTNCFQPIKDPNELQGLFVKAYKTMAEDRAKKLEKMNAAKEGTAGQPGKV